MNRSGKSLHAVIAVQSIWPIGKAFARDVCKRHCQGKLVGAGLLRRCPNLGEQSSVFQENMVETRKRVPWQ